MMLAKFPYYFNSLFKLGMSLKNPQALAHILWKKNLTLEFNNQLQWETLQRLDILILKETLLDDVYHLKKLPKSVRTIIDVGAGIGDFSILAATFFPRARVIAFEPTSSQFKTLLRNIKTNNIKNIQAYPHAVGSKSDYFLTMGNYNAQNTVSLNLPSAKKISAKRLDGFITGLIDLVKIDCEGAELDVLQSITEKKLRNIKRFAIEYHNYIVSGIDRKVDRYLKKNGFTIKKAPDPYISGLGYIYASQN